MSQVDTRQRSRAFVLLSLWNLYTYIYCMLTSQALVEMAIFGGALYMSTQVSAVFFHTYAGDARYLLPQKMRAWRAAILVVLLGIIFSIFVIYPSRLDNPSLWMLFALVICLTVRDGFSMRLIRHGLLAQPRLRSVSAYAMLHIVPLAFVFAVYLVQLPWDTAWPLCVGYLVSELLSLLYQRQLILENHAFPADAPTREQLESLHAALNGVNMYKGFSIINLFTVCAMELTTVLLYTHLANDSAQSLVRIALAAFVSLLCSSLADRWFRRRQRHQTSDPVNLLLVGLFLWFFGLNLYRRARLPLTLSSVLFCLALCTAGTTLCLQSLGRLEQSMARVMRYAAGESLVGYWQVRTASMEWAQLLGQMIALAAMTILCLRNPANPLSLSAVGSPLLVLAPLFAVLVAFTLTFRFPLSNRILDKISRLLRLQEEGVSNPALEHQLEDMVIKKHMRPYFVNAAKAVVRTFYRYKLVDAERIHPDEENPLVFLCNHGYINGPVVAMSHLPVNVRPWVIDKVAIDVDQVTEYLYHNDFENNERIPRFLRHFIPHQLAKLSVWGMAQTEPIPVFRDNPGQLIRTFRASVEALQAGDNLLIFPENPNGISEGRGYETEGLGPLFSGFAMLAQIYYRRTGKCCRFLPMYILRDTRTVAFGEEIRFDPAQQDGEVERISREAERQMRELMRKCEKQTT